MITRHASCFKRFFSWLFQPQFINNRHDITQGPGNPEKMQRMIFRRSQNSNSGNTNKSSTAATPISMDDVMLSTISSLKLQLLCYYTIGNCCSNFHLLLFDYLRDGCGGDTATTGSPTRSSQITECLQENQDPRYRLCCKWSTAEECRKKKKQNKVGAEGFHLTTNDQVDGNRFDLRKRLQFAATIRKL